MQQLLIMRTVAAIYATFAITLVAQSAMQTTAVFRDMRRLGMMQTSLRINWLYATRNTGKSQIKADSRAFYHAV
ncbi:hypothetical protein V1522DRAFT_414367 [Lipomyces starkeyi]